MRPSIPVSLNPGLERAVPWGRDLYTFVTSAAGHMMRTLQKPRKNRPSKRQVNHRRFLHNMIQRKFADIEAANHRLASAIYFKDVEKNLSEKTVIKEQSANVSQSDCAQDSDKVTITDGLNIPKSEETTDSHVSQILERIQDDKPTPESSISKSSLKKTSPHLTKSTPGSSLTCADDNGSPELFHFDYYNDNSQIKPLSSSEETKTSLNESNFTLLDQMSDLSPWFSPQLSPLSFDWCDVAVPACSDRPVCLQAQMSMADICEDQLTDILDLLCVGSKELDGCKDLEAYFDNLCASNDVAGPDFDCHEEPSAALIDSFTEMEHLHSARVHSRYEKRSSCREAQVAPNDQINSEMQRQSVSRSEEQFYCHPTQIHTSTSCHSNNVSRPQEWNTCMLVSCDNHLSFTPFEGVAQSFSVPPLNHNVQPILTPPCEDDWLFTDILKETKSPQSW